MTSLITKDNISVAKNTQEWIGVVSNKLEERSMYFVTLDDLCVKLSDDTIVIIPKGFKFDGSSVPRVLEFLFRRYGPFLFAALIHDWMYKNDYKIEELGQKDAQKLADIEMLLWSDATNYKSNWSLLDNWLRYKAVRLFGKKVYKR
jgi:hypothetical protein